MRKFQLSNLREKQLFLILHCREGEQLVFFLSELLSKMPLEGHLTINSANKLNRVGEQGMPGVVLPPFCVYARRVAAVAAKVG